jgi:anti-sigma factor RsiW
MSAICPILRTSFDDYLADSLPAPQRRILREHLAACAECRRAAVEKDPSFAFARPFAAEPLAEAEGARILAAVRTGVAFRQTEQRIRRASGRRIAGSAAAAAATLALAVLIPGGGSARRVQTAGARPAATPAAAAQAAAARPLPVPPQGARPVEPAVSTSEATIYDLNPGAGREEPRVVWIVDRGLDI